MSAAFQSKIIRLDSTKSVFKKAAYKGKAAAPKPEKEGVLTRDFIFDRLYSSNNGYFLKNSH